MPLNRSLVFDHAPTRGKLLEPRINIWIPGDLAPLEQVLTVDVAGAAKGATSIPLTAALTSPINIGQWLAFYDTDGIEKLAFVTARAEATDTAITVAALDEAIAAADTADFPSYIADRTAADVSRSYSDSTFTTFNTGGNTDGVPVSNEKSVSMGGIYYHYNDGLKTAKWAAENESFVWLRILKPVPKAAAFTLGEYIEGRALISGLNETGSVDGFIEANIEANFRGVTSEIDATAS